jgi:aryl-phospho-beta-D-glucosidase BglC (GH1 family)
MNTENFINGYPGAEHSLRAVLAEVLGHAKAEFFFDRLLDHFLSEEDIIFMKESGATVVRLSFNYRHFERDAAPFQYEESAFKRLEQAVGWCAKHRLYAFLDLHAVQGWQNTDWHCDNATRHALFWDNPHYQDRWVALWKALAVRFRDVPAVAAYNVMNEPQTSAPYGRFREENEPRWDKINTLYRRIVKAVRSVDPDHIIILEGDNFSSRFDGLEAPFADNLLYSSHNYNSAGFGPGAYPGKIGGSQWDCEMQEKVFLSHQGTQFARTHNVPLWVGEFGSPYNGSLDEVQYRMQALDDQLGVLGKYGAHWTTWTYKDIGVMGWVMLDPESPYMKIVKDLLEYKRLLNTDFWMKWLPNTPAKTLIHNLTHEIAETLNDPLIGATAVENYLTQNTMAGFIGGLMQYPYARLFSGMSEYELDEILSSFAFKNCTPHPGLHEVMIKHLKTNNE